MKKPYIMEWSPFGKYLGMTRSETAQNRGQSTRKFMVNLLGIFFLYIDTFRYQYVFKGPIEVTIRCNIVSTRAKLKLSSSHSKVN